MNLDRTFYSVLKNMWHTMATKCVFNDSVAIVNMINNRPPDRQTDRPTRSIQFAIVYIGDDGGSGGDIASMRI